MAPDREESRAELLPEESSQGSDNPRAQADAILADSDERQFDQDASPGKLVEHRSSEEVGRNA
jgi:hypothetical protein